jgi:hypothetical protein
VPSGRRWASRPESDRAAPGVDVALRAEQRRYHLAVLKWLTRRPDPYDLTAFHRRLGLPKRLIHSESVARPTMAAYTAVFTDNEMLFELPHDLDPALRPLFGHSSILEGEFTRRLHETVVRDSPETEYARETLQTSWGGVVGCLAAEDPAVWAEIRQSRSRRPWVDVDGHHVKFGDGLEQRCELEIGSVLDIEPGMASLGGVHTQIDSLHKERPRHRFRYWVVSRHSFVLQMAWGMFTRLLVKETYEEKGRLFADLARQNKDYLSLHGSPIEVLSQLVDEYPDEPQVDLVIWAGPTLVAATDEAVRRTMELSRRLLRRRGVVLLGVPTDRPGAEERLAQIRADCTKRFRIKVPQSGQDAPYKYLWCVRR